MPIPADRLRSVVFEALRRDFGGQWVGLQQAVAWVAINRGLYPSTFDTRIIQIDRADEPRLRSLVEGLIAEGVIRLGIDGSPEQWPWLSLTPLGRELVSVAEDASPRGPYS